MPIQPQSAGTAGGVRDPPPRLLILLAGKVVQAVFPPFTRAFPWGAWARENKCFKRPEVEVTNF